MTHKTVLDVMSADVVTVTTRTPFKDLVGLMVGKGISAVPVLGCHGEVVGVVTETDLLKKQSLQQDPASPRPMRRVYRARWSRASDDCAGEVMAAHPVTVRPEATVAEASRLMDRCHCGCLPVVNEAGKLAGTVRHDRARAVSPSVSGVPARRFRARAPVPLDTAPRRADSLVTPLLTRPGVTR